jgi:membrane protease YdiL (CAAX protease family)
LGTAATLLIWPEAPVGKWIFLLAKLWVLALPLFWLLVVQRGRISWSPPRSGGFGMAALLGTIIAVLIAITYLAALRIGLIGPDVIAARAAQTGLDQLGFYLAGALYWITLNSLMEEYVWRWFVFRRFESLIPAPAAVLATSAGFTAHHIIALMAQFHWPVTVLASLGVFVGGAVWSWLYLRYRSIWPCYVSHAIVDLPIFIIGYDLIFLKGA